MSGDGNAAPVIIKRKKVVGGDGHHGGAWKVAYADFVTAMMAFFMLMWLLNATTEKQRKGIADYFSPTIAMARVSGGGDGALGGESVFSENVLPQVGTGATSLRPTSDNQAAGSAQPTAEDEELQEQFLMVEEALMSPGGESLVSEELLQQINLEITDEGLVIEFFEVDRARLFDDDAKGTPLLRQLMSQMMEAAALVENPIAIEVHTHGYPLVLATDPAWDISSRRATEVYDLLLDAGVSEDRVSRITAHADREPSQPNPMDIRNSRIEMIFLRQ